MACGTPADLKRRSVFNYNKVLLFNYDVQCRRPFRSYFRNQFSGKDINPNWFTGPLTPSNRQEVLSLRPLGGGNYSVFAKIEIGTGTKRRDEIEENLNFKYQEMIDRDIPIDEAYNEMVSSRPSKILSGWTYEAKPKPLRSSRTAGEFRETEVSLVTTYNV